MSRLNRLNQNQTGNHGKTIRELSHKTDKSLLTVRFISVITLFLLFIAPLNPARLSGLISPNASLFTLLTGWGKVADGFVRAIARGWVQQSTLNLVLLLTWITGIGLAAVAAGACLSLGNSRMKQLGLKISAAGALTGIAGVTAMYIPFMQFWQTEELQRVDPILGIGYFVFLALFIILLISVGWAWKRREIPAAAEGFDMEGKYRLFLMILPFLILVVVFSYLPLWGWRFAFFDYQPGSNTTMENFAGLKWFRMLFANPATRNDMIRVVRNTLAMSALGIGTSWLPMVFAMFLVEMRSSSSRRLVQTLTTIPNFISWVLVYTFAFALFSTEGFVNQLLQDIGLIREPQNFLMSSRSIWIKMWAWGTWKGLGWSAIIYIASIAGIDQQLYEAASIDGAGRFQRMRHITLPGLMPTFSVLLLLSIANLLSNGMEQYFVFRNSANRAPIEVLDLYVYTLGLGTGSTGNIPLATLIGMMKSLISVVLLFFANRVSKQIRGDSLV